MRLITLLLPTCGGPTTAQRMTAPPDDMLEAAAEWTAALDFDFGRSAQHSASSGF